MFLVLFNESLYHISVLFLYIQCGFVIRTNMFRRLLVILMLNQPPFLRPLLYGCSLHGVSDIDL